ncbi:MAG: tRNA (N6-isopentenyl adenosine(37)-C2)-methylthiotransferase MiaB [Elusimicrobia bacterium RIFOXYD2_FULL_34_15]|nr:MAG: tRNA (N6-isopentenyl adenosine(37)-C2)-methylthiotransferase MiaB [Elusimicrobia bacterium RIFOXYD2_FULL_34_15]
MNVADSDTVAQQLIEKGFSLTEQLNESDIIIINTCTVRQHAEDRAFSYIGDLGQLKIKNEKLKIVVLGCVASRLKESLKKKFPYIDHIIPANEIEKISEILKKDFYYTTSRTTNETFSEFITITRGCSNFCSYCIVPYVRGPEESRPVIKILLDIEKLTNSGKYEITLLGQNVNSYNFGGIDFADLLVKINDIPEVKKIGFMTSHPKDMSDKIIDSIASCEKVSHRIHLPLQSGSDKILKLMNRHYTKEKYLSIIEKLRKKIPDVKFTTDIIVGFPTETDEDFSETLEITKKVGFLSAYTFKYSPREYTKAFSMKDDVPMNIKKERLARLNALLKGN